MFKRGDTGVGLSLGTIVGLILAVMAILLVTSIVASMISVFSTEEESQFQNFLDIYTKIDENEMRDDRWKEFPTVGFVKEDFVIVGMSDLNTRQVTGDTYEFTGKCSNEYIVKKMRGWFDFSKEIELTVVRDLLKCPDDIACLCLCQFGKKDGKKTIDCVNGICKAFRSKGGKDITFKGTTGKGSCEIPLMYRNTDSDLVTYCIKRDNDYIFDFGQCLAEPAESSDTSDTTDATGTSEIPISP